METISYPKEIKANKDHQCNLCGQRIPSGDTYIKSTHKYDGDVYDFKTHNHCDKLANQLKMYDDCDEGLTQEIFEEIIYQTYFDLMLKQFQENEIQKYSEVIQQLRNVRWKDKLHYVIRHYNKLENPTP